MNKERAEEECTTMGEAYTEGYKQGRADAFDECIAYYSIHAKEVYKHISARDFICDRLEQLKEQKNDR